MGRPFLNFLQVASLVLVLVAVALLAAITTMHFAIHGAEVKVPALKAMTVAEARSQTAGLGLNLTVDNRYYSSEIAAGHILTQSPPPGSVVRREWNVRVSESLGPQTVDVPNTVGSDERMAALTLRRVGLGVGATARIPWPGAPQGTVLAQDPPAKAQGIERPTVNLLVADADNQAADGYLMPDLSGMIAASALADLARVGLQAAPPKVADVPIPPVGAPGTILKPPARPGTVVSQFPPAGVRVDPSITIRLTVAK